jgi:hypothetical protein
MRNSTHPEGDDADLHANPTLCRDGLSPRPCSPIARIKLILFTTTIQPSDQFRNHLANPVNLS